MPQPSGYTPIFIVSHLLFTWTLFDAAFFSFAAVVAGQSKGLKLDLIYCVKDNTNALSSAVYTNTHSHSYTHGHEHTFTHNDDGNLIVAKDISMQLTVSLGISLSKTALFDYDGR